MRRRVGRAWETFWFSLESPETLSLFRIAAGMVIVYRALTFLPYTKLFFSCEGYQTVPFPILGASPFITHLLYGSYLVALCCWLVGWHTRVSNVVAALLHLYFYLGIRTLNNQTYYEFVLLVLIATCGMPCGACYSLDWVHRGKPSPVPTESWGRKLLLVQLALIFAVAGFGKLLDPGWWTGEALRNALLTDWGTPVGRLVAAKVSPAILQMVSMGVVALELGFPATLLWPRTQCLLLPLAAVFLLLCAVFFDAQSLACLMIALGILYRPSSCARINALDQEG